MDLDPVLIARIQFAFTIIFHIIFPAFTIGLSAYIATLRVVWMGTGAERNGRYHDRVERQQACLLDCFRAAQRSRCPQSPRS